MTEDDKSVFRSILDHISGMDYIKPEDLPNIDLYMDQVTTFMDEHLSDSIHQAPRGRQDPHQDHDQQLCEEQPAPFPGEEALFQGSSSHADLHLLF